MSLLYNIGIKICWWVTCILSYFNIAVKRFCRGQKGVIEKIQQTITHDAPIIWVHCSSVGEFEQASPIMEWYKRERPQYRILLTFFSPNGYELRKNYDKADWIFYMPVDTLSNAKKFIATVKPAKAVFIKYEFWYNYLSQLKANGIETYIVAAIFRPTQHFFKWYGSFFRKMLRCYTKIFVQDEQSFDLLKSIGISDNAIICGDTRFDRVQSITKRNKEFPIIAQFAKDSFTFVAGSTWEPDEEIIADIIKHFPKIKLILAPHETDHSRISFIMERFRSYRILKYSALTALQASGMEKTVQQANIILIDSVGILSSLYKYGSFAYIGGGFGIGIHNILEAASYNLPVVFGPNHKKFKEAKDLLKSGGATCIHNGMEFYSLLNRYINVPDLLTQKGNLCGEYVRGNLGATNRVISLMEVQHLK